MAKVFICYRREDSAYPAQQIYEELTNQFGSESVIFNVDTIPLGVDFREYLNKEVSKCDILLAVIGNKWIEILKRRLDEPNDYVRIEIQAALERKIPVVPVLVDKASVPSEKNLPPEIAELAHKNTAEVHAGPDLQNHLKRLIGGFERLIAERKAEEEQKQRQEEKQKYEAVPKRYTNSIGMEFVLIPAGNFMMGSPISPEEVAQIYDTEARWYQREHPQHKVTISPPFYLQQTAVSRGQWKRVMKYNPSQFQDFRDACPVVLDGWGRAHEFINKVNDMERDEAYRLPTEAEWEYACRAGTTTDFSFGDNASKLVEYAWYRENSKGKTHPVGTKIPNAWGLYDMHGNVPEWVEDDWHGTYDGAPTDGSAWVGKKRGVDRVIRGGSWNYGAQDCRSAYRLRGPPYLTPGVGLRLARSVALGP